MHGRCNLESSRAMLGQEHHAVHDLQWQEAKANAAPLLMVSMNGKAHNAYDGAVLQRRCLPLQEGLVQGYHVRVTCDQLSYREYPVVPRMGRVLFRWPDGKGGVRLVEAYNQLRRAEGCKHLGDRGLRVLVDCDKGATVAAFVVVALIEPQCTHAAHEQLLAILYDRGIGLEAGLSTLVRADGWFAIYDKARSSAWLANAPMLPAVAANGHSLPRVTANVKTYEPRDREDVIFLVSKRSLSGGSDVWFAYGGGNGMLKEVRALKATRLERRPRVSDSRQRKQARTDRTAAARQARWSRAGPSEDADRQC